MAIEEGDFGSIATPGPEPRVSVVFDVDIADKTLVVVPEVLYKFYNTLVEDKRLDAREVGYFDVQCAHVGPKPTARVPFEEGYEMDTVETEESGVNSRFPVILLHNSILMVKVPKFENKVIYNWIAREISQMVFAEMITIGTAALDSPDSLLELGKEANFPLKTEMGIVGLPAAIYNFCQNKKHRFFIVNANGFFIDDFEIVSSSKFEFLASEIFKLKSTFFKFKEAENFLYL